MIATAVFSNKDAWEIMQVADHLADPFGLGKTGKGTMSIYKHSF